MILNVATNWLEGIFKIPELRRRVGFTFLMIVIYRLGVAVPTPGINAESLKKLFEQTSSTLFGMVNMFSGGALENFSVFALGIMPYISVSIIIQLMTTAFKPLEELSKEGESGRRVIARYTRIFTVLLALIQGFMISFGLEGQPGIVSEPGLAFRLTTAVTLAAGTTFIMWLGEQITEHGIGNGISLIIFAGIVARMPATLASTFVLMNTGEISIGSFWGLIFFGVLTVAFIVFVEGCQRRIPVQYPKRMVDRRRMVQATTQHLPLKLNSAGVIAAIFASAFLVFPATIAQFSGVSWLKDILAYVTPPSPTYYLLECLLIIFFSYFYTAIQFDPEKIAENLKKGGGFIPMVRPGKDTADFLSGVLSRITIWGALYVCVVCIVPPLFYSDMGASGFTAFFGGTAVLIAVGVSMDTISQINSHIVSRNYEAFMNKGPGKVRGMGRGASQGRLIQR